MSTNFGRELSCTTSIRTGRYVSGPRLVAEAIYRRLSTPRGMLRGGDDEANYGIDLADEIGSTQSKRSLASLPAKVKNECEKDERVASVDVTYSIFELAPGAWGVNLNIVGNTAEGPFSLQLRVTDVTVDLLGITAGEG